jgi:hypothetical protein
LVDECRLRDVRQAYSCPYHPQQDRAEGYLGRVTAMASFGMVFAGAPLWMWIWAIRVAVFVNNITATYFSREKVWAAPYELLHGEPFPDASIVMPFGCAALVLLDQKDLTKFQNRCALLVFVHYADEHSLYTYAFYSPRTKRILFRQDCIFLPSVFPMRIARQAAGLNPSGEPLIPYRSPLYVNGEDDSPHSFRNWCYSNPLPTYEDHVSGITLSQPFSAVSILPPAGPERAVDSYHLPFHPAFGEQSVVRVNLPSNLRRIGATELCDAADKPPMDSFHGPPSDSGDSALEPSPPDDHSNGDNSFTHHEQDAKMNGSSHGEVPTGNDVTSPRDDLPFMDPDSEESKFLIYFEFPRQDRPRFAAYGFPGWS